jgi:hypothetical protein
MPSLAENIASAQTRADVLALGPRRTDWCPCFEAHEGEIHIVAHCWRGECPEGCQFCGLHVKGLSEAEARRLMALLASDRHSAWTLLMEDE